MQTNTQTYNDRQIFLTNLMKQQARTSMGDSSTEAERAAYGLGYLTGFISSRPDIYEAVIEELASLGVKDPG